MHDKLFYLKYSTQYSNASRREKKRMKDATRIEVKQIESEKNESYPPSDSHVWCEGCRMWSDTSEPYGTCMCS